MFSKTGAQGDRQEALDFVKLRRNKSVVVSVLFFSHLGALGILYNGVISSVGLTTGRISGL